MSYPWSRIQRTELASYAIEQITENAMQGCTYHNLLHVDQMYEYLEAADEPYDEALDWAVLFHDAVYDAFPDKELRSARRFFEMRQLYRGCNLDINGIDRVQLLILETKKHLVTKESYLKGSSVIIRADLHALTSKTETIHNFVRIMDESLNLYDCSVEQFAQANADFMQGLKLRIQQNIETCSRKEDAEFFKEVVQGIDLTLKLARALL